MEEDTVTEKLVLEVQSDLPTIYTSVKNLIAYLLGKNFESPLDPQISSTHVMTCAKYLLEAIRTCHLPDLEQFCVEQPQPQEQSGIDRLDDVCKYKVIYGLREKALAKDGKITRLFGRKYIVWSKCWSLIKAQATSLIQANSKVPLEEIELFIIAYETSLASKGQPLPVFCSIYTYNNWFLH